MRRRIFWSITLVALGSVLLLAVFVVGLSYRDASKDTWLMLEEKAFYVGAGMEDAGPEYLEQVRDYSGRTTLIAPDGTVLFDDKQDPATMDNHADRPEVAAAMQNGVGREERFSDTQSTRTLYYALRLPDGNILRVSADVGTVWSEALTIVPWLAGVLVLVLLVASVVARWQTKAILAPINEIDLAQPLEASAYGELSPLLRRIAAQQQQIAAQMQQLEQKQEEFAVITKNMEEGLVVVNREGQVLSINQSARVILHAQAVSATGRHILELRRDLALDEAVKDAVAGHHNERIFETDGHKFRLAASPASHEGVVQGAVLLFVNETEKLEAEATRREFAANVSHELNTPLTSIRGYAEIMQHGMVDPKDIPDFSGRIFKEAGRLIALIEDIIKLSKLDEKEVGSEQEQEEVDLLALAEHTAESLCQRAEEKDVEVQVYGVSAWVRGVRTILEEVLYNLVDNAIRYNKIGGRVEVEVRKEKGEVVLRVQDTGIGILPEHQLHVFERFYQVEKSGAYAGGGTGLGLSIVKRGVLFHGGSVTLESAGGKGSTFVVRLPGER